MNDNETNLLTKESTEEIKAEHPYEVEKKTEEQTEISDEYGNVYKFV